MSRVMEQYSVFRNAPRHTAVRVDDVALPETGRGWRKWLALLAACVGLAAARWTFTSSDIDTGHWMQVARDSSYDIAMDTVRIRRRDNAFEIWYRTDHAITHLYKDKAFNREIVQSLLRCGNMTFKIARVDMSLRGHGVIAQQLAGPGELGQQPWRAVERGTIEATAAEAACDVIRRYVIQH